MDTGDFNETPPPSNRPSLSIVRVQGESNFVTDIKAAITPGLSKAARQSGHSLKQQELLAAHQVDCLLSDAVEKVAATKVLVLEAGNKGLSKPNVVEENKLLPRRVPAFGQIHWPKEPARSKSSSSLHGLFSPFRCASLC